MSSRLYLLAILLVGGTLAHASDNNADVALLKSAGYSTDAKSLLSFFRQRTLTPQKKERVRHLLSQLGHIDFEIRERASDELRSFGEVIRTMLREKLGHPDAEVVHRVRECLRELQASPSSTLHSAAARLLAETRHPEATRVLLDYLPFEDDSETEFVVHDVLSKLNPKGKLDPVLVRYLDSEEPNTRAAAGAILAWNGSEEQRNSTRHLLKDDSPKVRFFIARAWLAAGQDEGLEALIRVCAEDDDFNRTWLAEEILYRIAGEKSPQSTLATGSDKERLAAKKVWLAWLTNNRDSLDLARFHERNRLLGLTLGIEYNTGTVWECTPDRKSRWEITGLKGPMEAQVLRNGHILIAESEAHRISEWTTAGKLVRQTKTPGEPTGVQRLPNGNTFVSTYSSVMEFRPDGTQLYLHKLKSGSNGIRKHRNGNIIYVTRTGIVELSPKGHEIRTVRVEKGNWTGIRGLRGDRFLICSSGSGIVLEVDSFGKVLWRHKQPGSCGIERLANGNTLISASKLVVEVNRQGKTLWSHTRTGYVRRIHRR